MRRKRENEEGLTERKERSDPVEWGRGRGKDIDFDNNPQPPRPDQTFLRDDEKSLLNFDTSTPTPLRRLPLPPLNSLVSPTLR